MSGVQVLSGIYTVMSGVQVLCPWNLAMLVLMQCWYEYGWSDWIAGGNALDGFVLSVQHWPLVPFVPWSLVEGGGWARRWRRLAAAPFVASGVVYLLRLAFCFLGGGGGVGRGCVCFGSGTLFGLGYLV